MKKIISIFILSFFVVSCSLNFSCSKKKKPLPDPKSPIGVRVFEGQYIMPLLAASKWCGYGDNCQEEVNGETYLVTTLSHGWSILRKEGESRIVPYERSKDLCFTDFPEEPLCEPNWVWTANDQKVDWGMINIQMPAVWDSGFITGDGVVIVDSGIEGSHEDLKDKIAGCYSTLSNKEGSKACIDDNGHGTHVAGIIGAINNAFGGRGVGNIPLYACKFLGSSGAGSTSNAIKCVNWAVSEKKSGHRIAAINASWGCAGCYSRALSDAISRANSQGILFVAAAGNDSENNDVTHHYPSDYDLPGVISVAACNRNSKLAYFSNFGTHSVDLCAPGRDIFSTWLGGRYKILSGSSMASPHVAGAVAVLAHAGKENIKELLLKHVRKLPALSGKLGSEGTLDVQTALGATPIPTQVPCKRARFRCCSKLNCKPLRDQQKKWNKCKQECREKYNCFG